MSDQQSRIVELIRADATIDLAAQTVEVPVKTVRDWLYRGRKNPDGPYGEFARQVKAARSQPAPPLSGEPGDAERAVRASLEALGALDHGQRTVATALVMAARVADRARDRGTAADDTLALRLRAEIERSGGPLLETGYSGYAPVIERLWEITWEEDDQEGRPRTKRPDRASSTVDEPLPISCVAAAGAHLAVMDISDKRITATALMGAAEALDRAAESPSAHRAKPALEALREIVRLAEQLRSPAGYEDLRVALLAGSGIEPVPGGGLRVVGRAA